MKAKLPTRKPRKQKDPEKVIAGLRQSAQAYANTLEDQNRQIAELAEEKAALASSVHRLTRQLRSQPTLAPRASALVNRDQRWLDHQERYIICNILCALIGEGAIGGSSRTLQSNEELLAQARALASEIMRGA